MPTPPFPPHELQILEHIEADPEVTQANLAEQLGVAVGTVNFVVKRLVKKGYVRVTHLQRRRLKYIITPEGIAQRTQMALDSLQYSMRLYRETREQAKRLLTQVKQAGSRQVAIRGKGELADVVRLTCLEMEVEVTSANAAGRGPVIVITGTTLSVDWQTAGRPAAA